MEGFDLNLFIWEGLALLPGLLVGFTVHELAHALVAYALGDRGRHIQERLSLNPLRHVSWLGLLAFLFIRFGWAKPVRFDPRAFKHPNLDSFLVAIAGVTANFLVAILWGAISAALLVVVVLMGLDPKVVLDWLLAPEFRPWNLAVLAFTADIFWVNLVLAGLNLLPVPGLDGFHALVRVFLMVRGLFRRAAPPPAWLDVPPRAEPAVPDAVSATAPADLGASGDLVLEGRTYQRAGLLREAIAAYREALVQDPASLEAYQGLAQAYRMLGERRQAIAALGAALSRTVDPATREVFTAAMRDLGWQVGDPVPALEPPLANPDR